MMGYKDMIFCTQKTCALFDQTKCHRALTPEIIEGAEKWWGGKDFPICVFQERPDCYEEKPCS